MLGGKGPLSDIPERVGYDRVLLGIETLDEQTFTLVRSAEGGAFRVFDRFHVDVVPDSGGNELADQHNERRDDNLSTILLSKIDLSHKRVRRNKRGDTQNLTAASDACHRSLSKGRAELAESRTPSVLPQPQPRPSSAPQTDPRVSPASPSRQSCRAFASPRFP